MKKKKKIVYIPTDDFESNFNDDILRFLCENIHKVLKNN